jgi:beta-N-acetylhexosaminidase
MRRRSFLLCGIAAGIAGSAPALAEGGVKFGQLLITGFRGTSPEDPEVDVVRSYLSQGTVAGVLLLRRNVVSPEQLEKLSDALREATPGPAPVIAIDQEGGRVSRLDATNGFRTWMSAAEVAASGMNEDDVIAYYTERAREMSAAGINLNLAPVVDLNVNPFNPIIGMLGRSYGHSVEVVVRHASMFVRAHRAAGVMTSLKHFPGHGSSVTDSHHGEADISGTWQVAEAEPFRALVAQGLADTIMTGHLLHPTFSDWRGAPASLSRRTVDHIRATISFRGPVITDDMQMRAVSGMLPLGEAAVAAVNAGNSLLIYSNYRNTDRVETVRAVESVLRMAEAEVSTGLAMKQVARVTAFRSRLT